MRIYQSFLINNLHSKLECTTLKMKKTSDEIIRQEDQTEVYRVAKMEDLLKECSM